MELYLKKPGSCRENMPDILLQWVKYMMKEEFDPVIENEIEQTGKLTQQTWKITAHNISKKIKESQQMTNFLANMQTLIDRGSHDLPSKTKLSEDSNLQLSDPRQIEDMFQQAFSDSGITTKLEALNMLLQSQLLHVMINSNQEISSRYWEKLNPYLRRCLYDEDMKIFTQSFKINVKLVNSSQPHVVKEGFENLVDALVYLYSQNNINLPSFDVDSNEPNLIRITKLVHLLLFTVNKTSHHFIKVNDKLSEFIMERMFRLLTFPTNKNVVGPYSIVSAIDPHATWFQHALHGNVMQDPVFFLLLKSALINELVSNIINYDKANNNKYQYATFIHSIEMFRTIVKYKQGRSLFPVSTNFEDHPITIERIYMKIIRYLADGKKMGAKVLSDALVDGISVCLDTGLLKNDSPMMKAILEPLPLALPNHSLRALEAIVATENGVQCLVAAQNSKALLNYTCMALNHKIIHNPKEKIMLLKVCGRIMANHEGFTRNMESSILLEVVSLFQQENPVDEPLSMKDALFQCISNIGSTPLGIYALSQMSGLLEELTLMWSSSGKIDHLRCLALASFLDVDQQWSDLPPLYVPRSRDRSDHRVSELSKFLQNSRDVPHDSDWNAQLRAAFTATPPDSIKAGVVLDLVEQLALDSSLVRLQRSKSDLDGVSQEMAEWVIRYGECNNLMHGSQKNIDSLLELFSSFGSGEDWFIATAFLLCGGHADKCRAFLSSISSLPAGAVLWPDKQSEQYYEQSFQFGHNLEAIVEIEFPIASKALRMSGISWWYVTHMWISHSFLPSQKWSQICQWIIYCLITPRDQNLYYCLALLKHMEPSILKSVDDGTIVQLIRKPIDGFVITKYLTYIDKLSERYETVFC